MKLTLKCELCIRRPRDEGGNESCHLYQKARGWPEHLRQWPSGCASFKVGDLRTTPRHVGQQGGLF